MGTFSATGIAGQIIFSCLRYHDLVLAVTCLECVIVSFISLQTHHRIDRTRSKVVRSAPMKPHVHSI